jgi:hypothetical protein
MDSRQHGATGWQSLVEKEAMMMGQTAKLLELVAKMLDKVAAMLDQFQLATWLQWEKMVAGPKQLATVIEQRLHGDFLAYNRLDAASLPAANWKLGIVLSNPSW